MLDKCICGNYINFAICDFYNDNSFAEITTMLFKAILNQDLKQLFQYEKLTQELYKLLDDFFKKNSEMIFLKFDPELLKNIVEKILVPGLQHDK